MAKPPSTPSAALFTPTGFAIANKTMSCRGAAGIGVDMDGRRRRRSQSIPRIGSGVDDQRARDAQLHAGAESNTCSAATVKMPVQGFGYVSPGSSLAAISPASAGRDTIEGGKIPRDFRLQLSNDRFTRPERNSVVERAPLRQLWGEFQPALFRPDGDLFGRQVQIHQFRPFGTETALGQELPSIVLNVLSDRARRRYLDATEPYPRLSREGSACDRNVPTHRQFQVSSRIRSGQRTCRSRTSSRRRLRELRSGSGVGVPDLRKKCTVVMPSTSAKVKVDAVRSAMAPPLT